MVIKSGGSLEKPGPELGNRCCTLFDNLDELLTPQMAAIVLHTTPGTIYQWKCRPKKHAIPDGLFLKVGRKLLLRREILKTWILSRST